MAGLFLVKLPNKFNQVCHAAQLEDYFYEPCTLDTRNSINCYRKEKLKKKTYKNNKTINVLFCICFIKSSSSFESQLSSLYFIFQK